MADNDDEDEALVGRVRDAFAEWIALVRSALRVDRVTDWTFTPSLWPDDSAWTAIVTRRVMPAARSAFARAAGALDVAASRLTNSWDQLTTATGGLLPAAGWPARLFTAVQRAWDGAAQRAADVRAAVAEVLTMERWRPISDLSGHQLAHVVRQAATQAAASVLAAAGTPLTKTWMPRADERVRAEHRQARGQTVPVSEPFEVGGFPLMYPGDPTAPPHLSINCRCRMTVRRA
ncbi:phage minor head protein [Streptomyces alboflavus]|uniref:phage minor head protein n=1 Tax=Streptomyces alboflavus TaxID=67267 RepID=UPI0036C9423C